MWKGLWSLLGSFLLWGHIVLLEQPTKVWIRGSMVRGEGDLELQVLYLLVGEPTLLICAEDTDGDKKKRTLFF